MPKFKVGDVVRYKNEATAANYSVNDIRGKIYAIAKDHFGYMSYYFEATVIGGYVGHISIRAADEVGGDYELELVP